MCDEAAEKHERVQVDVLRFGRERLQEVLGEQRLAHAVRAVQHHVLARHVQILQQEPHPNLKIMFICIE